MTLLDRLSAIDDVFLAGKAGLAVDAAIRTVSSWCEHGLLISPSRGRGDRRRFSALQVVEIGIIKEMSDSGIPLTRIKWVMEFLRSDGNLKSMLSVETAHMVISPFGEASVKLIKNWSKATTRGKASLLEGIFEVNAERVFIFDITRIAKSVLDKL